MRLIYLLGRKSKLFRLIYYKLSKGHWLWGIAGYLRDYPVAPEQIEKCPETHEGEK